MSLTFVALAGAYCAAEKIKGYMDRKKESARREAIMSYKRGELPGSVLTVSDIMKDWKSEKMLFPKELCGYLSKNPAALTEYAKAVCRDANSPYHRECLFINRPFIDSFFKTYGRKMRVFNNTGVLYY
ncbi:MAG: hypothetical protein E7623_07010 [Ruminococcaceae bacterium]|nr:hypothetical protein [Oscillospiraceae bacterium]